MHSNSISYRPSLVHTMSFAADMFSYIMGAFTILQVLFFVRVHLPHARAKALREALSGASVAYNIHANSAIGSAFSYCYNYRLLRYVYVSCGL